MSQLFASGGQSIGISASTSVLPMNTQDWSPLGWTGWISLQSKRLSRVFSKYHVFDTAQPRLSSHFTHPLSTWQTSTHLQNSVTSVMPHGELNSTIILAPIVLCMDFPVGSEVKNLPTMRETWVQRISMSTCKNNRALDCRLLEGRKFYIH